MCVSHKRKEKMKVKDVDFRLVLGSAVAENKPVVLNGCDYKVSWNGVEWELEGGGNYYFVNTKFWDRDLEELEDYEVGKEK